jgi:hypothetical protein
LRAPAKEQNDFGDNQMPTTHPSHEWQDQVISKMLSWATQKSIHYTLPKTKPILNLQASAIDLAVGDGDESSPRRLRRKIGSQPELHSRFYSSPPNSPHSSSHHPSSALSVDSFSMPSPKYSNHVEGEREVQLEEAVGQLSLNEDEQVRFHGKTSGLHLLGVKERVDGRNEGGIWKFPKARVWPPLPGSSQFSNHEEDFDIVMPDQQMQTHLMELYWTYVHPALPVVHKQSFIETMRRRQEISQRFRFISCRIS